MASMLINEKKLKKYGLNAIRSILQKPKQKMRFLQIKLVLFPEGYVWKMSIFQSTLIISLLNCSRCEFHWNPKHTHRVLPARCVPITKKCRNVRLHTYIKGINIVRANDVGLCFHSLPSTAIIVTSLKPHSFHEYKYELYKADKLHITGYWI